MLKAVIMAGGSGKRLWPLSRKNQPKQCLSLVSEKSLLEDAVERMNCTTDKENISIVTTQEIEQQLKALVPDVTYIKEPLGRGTAASIGLAAIAQQGNPVIVIGTADHAITDVELFAHEVKQASALADNDNIVLFGIPITRPETGYGYIQRGKALPTRVETYTVAAFTEKPNHTRAVEYMHSGKYFWNSGMFIAKKNVLLSGIKQHLPELWNGLSVIRKSNFDADVMKNVFTSLSTVSIDVGIIEKSINAAVVNGTFPWDDVGDFLSFSRLSFSNLYRRDKDNNVIRAKYQGGATNSVIIGTNRIIYAEQVSDCIIVDTPDVVMVCKKDKSQDVGKLVHELERHPQFQLYTQGEGPLASASYCYSGQNDIKSTCFVATVGVSGLEIFVNSQSVIVKQVSRADKQY